MSTNCNGCGDCDRCPKGVIGYHEMQPCIEWTDCDICGEIIEEDYYSIDGKDYHIDCFEDKYKRSV